MRETKAKLASPGLGAAAAGSGLRIAVHDYAGHPFQFELSRALAARGHTVRHFFFADDPGPKGESRIGPGDPSTFSVEPLRVRMRYSKDRMARRLLGDLLYARCARRRITAFRPHIVISSNTPLDAQRAIARAAEHCGARFVFWVQDFYGIAMERLLASRWHGLGRVIVSRYRALERTLLEKSHSVVLISPDFEKYLPAAVQSDANRIHVIRNWGPLGTIAPVAKVNGWSRRQGLSDKFVFMYTGTLALKHDPRLLLALADSFANDPAVAIVVAATGVNADWLRNENAERPRANLHLLPLQPASDFAEVLGTADVLVALLESDAAEFSVPSKMLGYLCAGRPILLSAPSSNLATQVLTESGAGLSIEPRNVDDLILAAGRLRNDPEMRADCQARARDYAEAHFSIGPIVSRFESAFTAA